MPNGRGYHGCFRLACPGSRRPSAAALFTFVLGTGGILIEPAYQTDHYLATDVRE